MCGIAGIIHKNNQAVDRSILEKMNRALMHRGPDDEGYHCEGSLGLAHRRLSIIDLSGGHQPMSTADGRYTIVFNGEIYNFLEIKANLQKKGISFKTNSDTEVLLYAYALEGKKCLDRLNGMFSFAIWDKNEKTIFAARDRFGKKPFYYWDSLHHFAFASELKAFLVHPDFKKELNHQALSSFFQYEYVPAPLSIFKGVCKLPAGHFLIWKEGSFSIQKYWDIPLKQSETPLDWEESKKKLIVLLDEATQKRLVSDVPLGVFLSGGLDSSSIVAMMARHRSGSHIKTFSIGFDEKSFDESEHALFISKHFKTDHHHQVLTPGKMLEILPRVVSFMDEPFADYSIIPTYLLAQFTRQKVTVALGGDGSDELFAGYPTFYADRLARMYQKFPYFFKKGLQFFVDHLPVSHRDMSFDFKARQFLYGVHFESVLRNQVWLGSFHFAEQKKLFVDSSQLKDPLLLVRQALQHCPSSDSLDRILYFYQKFYLTDDILVKTDRASMATSLEVRAPYLDLDLVSFVSSLPSHFKLKGRVTKYILKEALKEILPSQIIFRKKKGFGIPVGLWLKNELRSHLLEILSPERIKRDGIFNPAFVECMINQHLEGRVNHRKKLFSLLTFHWWKDQFFNYR